MVGVSSGGGWMEIEGYRSGIDEVLKFYIAFIIFPHVIHFELADNNGNKG